MISPEKIRTATKTIGRVTQDGARIVRRVPGFERFGKLGLIGIAGVAGLVVCAASWSWPVMNSADPAVVHVDRNSAPLIVEPVSPSGESSSVRDETVLPTVTPQTSVANSVPAQTSRELEISQLRQQAQVQLDQSAADYDFAVRMWNAEVAACQAAPHARYTPNQMGRFAAMGVSAPMQQQRQPNQALFQAAQQAEQRYLQARDHYQRLTASN